MIKEKENMPTHKLTASFWTISSNQNTNRSLGIPLGHTLLDHYTHLSVMHTL